jgi:hypothetical protein
MLLIRQVSVCIERQNRCTLQRSVLNHVSQKVVVTEGLSHSKLVSAKNLKFLFPLYVKITLIHVKDLEAYLQYVNIPQMYIYQHAKNIIVQH